MSFRIPIVRLYDDLIVPVQVELSDDLALRLKDDVSNAIRSTETRGLVIDLSGVDILDSYITRVIHDIGAIARLMGTRAVVSGIDPLMAMALVEMGMDFGELATARNLEGALESLDELCRPDTETGGESEEDGRDQDQEEPLSELL